MGPEGGGRGGSFGVGSGWFTTLVKRTGTGGGRGVEKGAGIKLGLGCIRTKMPGGGEVGGTGRSPCMGGGVHAMREARSGGLCLAWRWIGERGGKKGATAGEGKENSRRRGNSYAVGLKDWRGEVKKFPPDWWGVN